MPSNKSSCNCPSPPGGTVTCEADQIAICRIKNGQLEAACVDPPLPISRYSNLNEYLTWALSEILGQRRSYFPIPTPDEMSILRQGFKQDAAGNIIVSFRLPKSLVRRFPQINNWPSVKQP